MVVYLLELNLLVRLGAGPSDRRSIEVKQGSSVKTINHVVKVPITRQHALHALNSSVLLGTPKDLDWSCIYSKCIDGVFGLHIALQ